MFESLVSIMQFKQIAYGLLLEVSIFMVVAAEKEGGIKGYRLVAPLKPASILINKESGLARL